MKLIFEKVMTIAFLHEYFNNGIIGDLVLEPVADTLEKMNNNRLQILQDNKGFMLIRKLTVNKMIPEKLSLFFILKINNSDFPYYTLLSKPGSDQERYYSTSDISVLNEQSVMNEKLVFQKDLPPRLTGNHTAMAIVEVIADSRTDQEYYIHFNTQSLLWSYAIVLPKGKTLPNPTNNPYSVIADYSRGNIPFNYNKTKSENKTLLLGNTTLVFDSTSLPLSDPALNKLKISLNETATGSGGKTTVKSLPLPDIRNVHKETFIYL